MRSNVLSRPDVATTDRLRAWLDQQLDTAQAATPNPGRPLLHRLNRAEYANAIRDLLALDVDAATLLPPDDSSYGFDNIADSAQGLSSVNPDTYLFWDDLHPTTAAHALIARLRRELAGHPGKLARGPTWARAAWTASRASVRLKPAFVSALHASRSTAAGGRWRSPAPPQECAPAP